MFAARDLPTAIWIRDEAIAGPFCVHCGWPLSMHADDLRCRVDPCPFLPPSCDCHEIRRVKISELSRPAPGRRRVRVEGEVLRIFRK